VVESINDTIRSESKTKSFIWFFYELTICESGDFKHFLKIIFTVSKNYFVYQTSKKEKKKRNMGLKKYYGHWLIYSYTIFQVC
jgi:hypothetical protein